MIDTVASIEAGFDRVEADHAAGSAGLNERDLLVLQMRFVEDMKQREIAEVIGVSQMQVSRIQRRALSSLLTAVQATG